MDDKGRFDLHRNIVTQLENKVTNRDWWLWLLIEEGEDPEVSVEGLGPEIDAWLAQGDPNGNTVLDSEEWVEGSLVFRLRALPKSAKVRGSSDLFGNPFAAVAFWTGS